MTPLLIPFMRRFLTSNVPGMAGDMRALWRAQSALVTTSAVNAALRSGEVPGELTEALRQSAASFVADRVAPRWRAAFASGARRVDSGFELLTPELVQEYVSRRQVFLLSGLTDQQSAALTQTLRDAIVKRMGPDELRTLLQGSVGLTERQSTQLRNLRESLEAADVTGAALRRQLERIAGRMQRQRADRIARTELASAHNGGVDGAIRRGIAQGAFEGDRVQKVWRTQGDARVDDKCCAPMEGMRRGLNDTFPCNNVQIPPAHVGCRCVVTYEVR